MGPVTERIVSAAEPGPTCPAPGVMSKHGVMSDVGGMGGVPAPAGEGEMEREAQLTA